MSPIQPRRLWLALAGAVLTALELLGCPLIGMIAGQLVFSTLPGYLGDAARVVLAAVPALAATAAGGALWGMTMGRLALSREQRRLAMAGALGVVPVVLLLGALLQVLEPLVVAEAGGRLPLQRVFTVLFVPTAFLVAGSGSYALAIGLRRSRLAVRLALYVGIAAALAFLAVDLLMEALGWQVGAPGAAARLTMLTVMFAGDLGAALAAGAVFGIVWSSTASVPSGSGAQRGETPLRTT